MRGVQRLGQDLEVAIARKAAAAASSFQFAA